MVFPSYPEFRITTVIPNILLSPRNSSRQLQTLKSNLQNQVEIYQKANQISSSFKVIIYFTEKEHERTVDILNKLGLVGKDNIVLIDGRSDNKISASKV